MVSPSIEIDGNSWLIGKISAYIECVKHEIKPVSEIQVPIIALSTILREIRPSGLRCLLVPEPGQKVALYLFKWPHVEHVIRRHLGLPHNKSVFQSWCDGKMFGYSEEEISRFMNRNN